MSAPTSQTTSRSFSRVVTSLVDGMQRSSVALGWVSRAGWVVLAVGVVSLIAGRWLGWVELVVVGGALLMLAVGAAAFAIGRHPYRVGLDLDSASVVVGERAMGAIVVANTSARPVLPARLELPVGAGSATFALPGLLPRGQHEELFRIPTHRRGVITVGPVSSVRGDPLGLVRRAVRWTEPHELYVHPRTISMPSSSAGLLHDLEGRATQDITAADLSFHTLREYVPGDEMRHVHWRSTARTGTLMVRQFEESRRSHLVLGLSMSERDYAQPDELELAISAAGSLGLYALGSDSDLTPMTTEAVLRQGSRRQLLDELTRLEAGRAPTTIVDLGRQITRDVPRATVVVLLFGSTVSPQQIRAAGAVLPVGVRTLAIRAAMPESELGTVRLGNVTVLTLPTLEELPRGFRRLER